MSVSGGGIEKLAGEFEQCRQILSALGDESRQHLICILKEAGILSMRREGTKHYYYFGENRRNRLK